MTEKRRKLLLSILAYFTTIALVAFVLFHQTIVKQMRAAKSPIATANPLDLPGVMSAAGRSRHKPEKDDSF
jgi:hypothetical protein